MNNYLEKYIKYKTKYLDLQNQVSGGKKANHGYSSKNVPSKNDGTNKFASNQHTYHNQIASLNHGYHETASLQSVPSSAPYQPASYLSAPYQPASYLSAPSSASYQPTYYSSNFILNEIFKYYNNNFLEKIIDNTIKFCDNLYEQEMLNKKSDNNIFDHYQVYDTQEKILTLNLNHEIDYFFKNENSIINNYNGVDRLYIKIFYILKLLNDYDAYYANYANKKINELYIYCYQEANGVIYEILKLLLKTKYDVFEIQLNTNMQCNENNICETYLINSYYILYKLFDTHLKENNQLSNLFEYLKTDNQLTLPNVTLNDLKAKYSFIIINKNLNSSIYERNKIPKTKNNKRFISILIPENDNNVVKHKLLISIHRAIKHEVYYFYYDIINIIRTALLDKEKNIYKIVLAGDFNFNTVNNVKDGNIIFGPENVIDIIQSYCSNIIINNVCKRLTICKKKNEKTGEEKNYYQSNHLDAILSFEVTEEATQEKTAQEKATQEKTALEKEENYEINYKINKELILLILNIINEYIKPNNIQLLISNIENYIDSQKKEELSDAYNKIKILNFINEYINNPINIQLLTSNIKEYIPINIQLLTSNIENYIPTTTYNKKFLSYIIKKNNNNCKLLIVINKSSNQNDYNFYYDIINIIYTTLLINKSNIIREIEITGKFNLNNEKLSREQKNKFIEIIKLFCSEKKIHIGGLYLIKFEQPKKTDNKGVNLYESILFNVLYFGMNTENNEFTLPM